MKYVKMFLLSFILSSVSLTGYAENLDFENMLIQTYIKEFGVSQDEAVRRLDMMNYSQPLIDELKNTFGDSIVAIYFDNGVDFKLVVRTTAKGRDLKELKTLLGTQNQIPVLIIRNSPRNARAIANIISNQSARLSQKIEGFSFMGYDPTQDKIIIHIYQPNIDKQNQLKNDQSLKKISGIEVEIVFLNEPLETLSLKGGAPINQSIQISASLTQLNDCTSGFPAVYNGKEGLITAAHCVDKTLIEKTPIVYRGYGNDIRTDMAVSFFDRNATTHDIMFVIPRTSAEVSNLYYINKEQTEIVTDYIEPVVGDLACKHGQITGSSCGTISQVSVGNSPDGGCPASFFGKACDATYVAIRGVDLKGSKGDSGGAVYVVRNGEKRPVGIVSSGASNQYGTVTVISPLIHLKNMGIRLKTK